MSYLRTFNSCSIAMVLVVMFNFTGLSQQTEVILLNDKFTISSKVLNEDRPILVRVPENYTQGSARFPVVYMLDGQPPRINLMTGTIQNLAFNEMAPEMILVSIPNTDRGRDMTPSVSAEQVRSGGADNFIRFIETELIPEVEKRYRTQPYRILVGHSLSGLFATYTFLKRPQLFNAYLSASPHLLWDDHFISKHSEEWLKQHQQSPTIFFVALGDEPEYLQGFNGLKDNLARSPNKKLEYEFIQLKEENHGTINAPVFHKGLQKIWAGLSIPAQVMQAGLPLAAVEKYYKDASEKYGYSIPIPEQLLNTNGYRLLQNNKMKEALEVFQENIQLYPSSANTYDSYAEALERDGQLQKAKDNLETGVKLALKGNNPELTRIMQENLKRVSGKLEKK